MNAKLPTVAPIAAPLPQPGAAAPLSLELAMVGNCTISALIDERGRVVWSCMPRFDSPPVFHALLDSNLDTGSDSTFGIELEQAERYEQAYDPGSPVLRTTVYDRLGGAIEIVDFMPRFIANGRIFRPAQLIRRIHRKAGNPRIRVNLRPSERWGQVMPTVARGSNHLRFVFPEHTYRLTTDAPLTYVLSRTWFTLRESIGMLWGLDESLQGSVAETVRRFEESSTEYWRDWTSRLGLPFEWQDAVIRAAITLKLCQYEETGAIVAAMTTSIPEAADSGRNWDYRYCWIRDAFFVVRALNSLSEVGTMESYLAWLHEIVRTSADGHVQPLYGIGLEDHIEESIVSSLAGYRGMGPVREGNQAFEHHQHDVYGAIILAASQSFYDHRLRQLAGEAEFRLLERMGERAWALHTEPDAGIWELRTRARVHTSSALMCWAACDRLAKVAHALGQGASMRRWRSRARTIRETILVRAWNAERGAFVESFEGHGLDASVLLMAEVGFIPARDPRFVSTVSALERHLCDGPYMRRYEEADDFGKPSTAFNICAFWYIDALARIGRTAQAREIFETMLARRNRAGLLSEDIVPQTGELWGNFPQTYSMVGVINGAIRLSRPWERFV